MSDNAPPPESFRPRIYVTFQQGILDATADEKGVSRPLQITLGPYLNVSISYGSHLPPRFVVKMWAEDTGGDRGEGHTFVLATMDGPNWVLHDGAENRPYASVEFHTRPPEPPAKKPRRKKRKADGPDENRDVGGEG